MINKQQKLVILRKLSDEQGRLTEDVLKYEIGSKEYEEAWEQLKKVSTMMDEVMTKKKFTLNDKWIPIIGSLLSIALIMTHEQSHVITTKAFGFIPKGRG